MSENSKIQWTDHTFNPWIGCRKVAPECAHCYAETLDRNRYSKTLDGGSKESPVSHWGGGPRHRTSASNWKQPLKWNRGADSARRKCGACGLEFESCWNRERATIPCPTCGADAIIPRPRVFCASLSDWLDDENVPIEWLADLLSLIYQTPNLDWLLLTKRPQNWRGRLEEVRDWCIKAPGESDFDLHLFVHNWIARCDIEPPANVWIGVSAGADQRAALDIPARIHFLSCEPMLRPMDTTHAAWFDWIIFGGESGSGARRCSTDWIRDGVKACRTSGSAAFVKQMGANCFDPTGEPLRLKDSHGGNMDEWPEDLRVREFPV